MTTSVIIAAHVSNDKEVTVDIKDGDKLERHILQDNEKQEFYVYDDIEITVKEVLKNVT